MPISDNLSVIVSSTGVKILFNLAALFVCIADRAREKSRVQVGLGFPSHWLKKLRESLKPITNNSNCNRPFSKYQIFSLIVKQ